MQAYITLKQWLPNFFKHEPNLSLMNISRHKPKTSKKIWLDHVVSSKSAHDCIHNIEILHQFILSDHRPVAATIKTAATSQNLLCDNKTKHEKNMNWNKATQQQKLKYQQASKIWLSKIPLFEELTSCDNPMCKKQKHIDML